MVAGLMAFAACLPAADVIPDRVAVFMRAKLAHSQNVLEGLATEDFDLIERGAQELSLASQDSNWQVLQTEDYVRQSAEFRRACDSLRDAAQRLAAPGAIFVPSRSTVFVHAFCSDNIAAIPPPML